MSAASRRPVLLGVGAAFDIHAGTLAQAPGWMQRHGLEWLYRLVREPRRLWRRYLSNIPRFLFEVARRRPRLMASMPGWRWTMAEKQAGGGR